MEFLILLAVFAISIFGLGRIFHWFGAASKATARTVTGRGSLKENFSDEFTEMGAFEARTRPSEVEISGKMVRCCEIEVRGKLQATRSAELALVTSAFDFTQGEWSAVISALDFFQESSSRAFQNRIDAGAVSPDQGYKRWVPVARLFPDTLTGERSGKRKIRVLVRALPKEETQKIQRGLHEQGTEIFCTAVIDIDLILKEKGWHEAIEERNEARGLAVRIAVAVGMFDGPLSSEAAARIKAWMQGEIGKLADADADSVKTILNSALKEGFAEGQQGNSRVIAQSRRLRELAFRSINQSLIELLMDIVRISGSRAECISTVRQIGSTLDIDLAEIQAMSDKTLLQIDELPENQESLEALLGINPSWSKEQIRKYIAGEFVKWNGRIHALESGREKEKAQRMLEVIAEARSKYG